MSNHIYTQSLPLSTVIYYTIYQITNLINQKIYVGMHKTTNLNDNYFGSGKHIRRAIKKYGIENFQKDILFVFDNKQDMLDKEQEIVSLEFCARKDTYNLKEGGQGGFDYINENNMGGFSGRTHTAESLQKISEKLTGRTYPDKIYNFTDEGRAKIGETSRIRLTGVPKTEEHKAKISKTLTGRLKDEEELEKARENMAKARALKPKITPDSTRNKIGDSLKIAYASGKRKRRGRDWLSIKNDMLKGITIEEIMKKYDMTLDDLRNGKKAGKLKGLKLS